MTIQPHRPDESTPVARLRLRLNGVVQGVGMRPFVFQLARRLGLTGFVLNDAQGVLVEVEGARVDDFAACLVAELPPLARIDALAQEAIAPQGETAFVIRDSAGGRAATRIPADAATCPDCLAELFAPASRFHLYPFITCTHCGPRFTITRAVPYDRAQTTMAGFAMCPACAADYADPGNRRFHAEPIACPACGPQLSAPIADIAAALVQGRIVALKGVGGFHLMCDARNEAAVAILRQRKAREAKPFAVMLADSAAVAAIALPTRAELSLLETTARPIVLVAQRVEALAPSVAPHLARIGVVLAYAPVHHLLFAALPQGFALVATSANPGGEPLAIDDEDARRRLAGIADMIVTHDRPIAVRADDSVMQIVDGAPAFLRRARGFVPDPIDLGADGPCVLAVGAHLKSTFCLTRGREAFVSQHIGDLDTAETLRFQRESLAHLKAALDVEPEVVACDLHPDYASTRWARQLGPPVVAAQHHAAHVAAIAAEHGVTGPLIGVALDGHGFGDDGGAWGGELMRIDGDGWTRLGHLAPLALPGGDRAAREPWRMGLAALARLGRLDEAQGRFADTALAGPLAQRLKAGASMPLTTSMGRLFDAAAALLGLRAVQDYEGQAAMELEALVRAPQALADGFDERDGVLDFLPLLEVLARGTLDRRAAADMFHGTLVEGLAEWIGSVAPAGAAVALGGGCMMNRTLSEGLCAALRARGLRPLLARAVPPNDGGLSLGQAALALAQFR